MYNRQFVEKPLVEQGLFKFTQSAGFSENHNRLNNFK